MIIVRVDPARTRQTATHHGERFANVPRDFKTGEQTGHDKSGSKSA
jgi:hypothetical protein